MSVYFVDGQLKRAGRLDFEGRNFPTIISGSGAATIKGRAMNILTLLFNLKDFFSEMLHTEKPTTLKDSYSRKITLFCCFYPSILYSHLPPALPWQTAKTHQTKFRHKSQPVEAHLLHLENEKANMRERDEDRGSRVSQLQVVSRCGGSGDKPLWHGLGLPSLHFSSHCSTSCLSDRSHLAWQREWRHSTGPPSQVWPLHATRQRVQANKMHTCTHVHNTSHPHLPLRLSHGY